MEKKIKVTIVGETPLLMHRMNIETYKQSGKTKIPTPEAEAKSYVYMNEQGLYMPSVNLHRTIWNAAKIYKVGGRSIAPFIMGSMRIEPLEISLGTKKYEVDVRPAVVQRSRVLRARPLIRNWKMTFTIFYLEGDLPSNFSDMIRDIISDAGHRVGIGDFRPATSGAFGRFKIENFEVCG